jgi:cytochrome c
MMKRIFALLFVFSVGIFLSGLAVAGDKATKEECVAKCKEAAAMVKEKGLEATLQTINDKNGPFVWKDTYVFCLDLNKTCNIAHPIKPKLIGKNLTAAKDAGGKLFFAEFINVAKDKGEGWVSYMWPKPGEKNPSPKITYVYKVPGEDVAMLAGIYE